MLIETLNRLNLNRSWIGDQRFATPIPPSIATRLSRTRPRRTSSVRRLFLPVVLRVQELWFQVASRHGDEMKGRCPSGNDDCSMCRAGAFNRDFQGGGSRFDGGDLDGITAAGFLAQRNRNHHLLGKIDFGKLS